MGAVGTRSRFRVQKIVAEPRRSIGAGWGGGSNCEEELDDSELDESFPASEAEERRGVGIAGEITGVQATSSSSNGSVSSDSVIGELEGGVISDASTVAGDMTSSICESNCGIVGQESEDMIL